MKKCFTSRQRGKVLWKWCPCAHSEDSATVPSILAVAAAELIELVKHTILCCCNESAPAGPADDRSAGCAAPHLSPVSKGLTYRLFTQVRENHKHPVNYFQGSAASATENNDLPDIWSFFYHSCDMCQPREIGPGIAENVQQVS